MDLRVMDEFDKLGQYLVDEKNDSALKVVFGKFLELNSFTISLVADPLIEGQKCEDLQLSNPREMMEFAIYKKWIHFEKENGISYLVAEAPVENFAYECKDIRKRKFSKWKDSIEGQDTIKISTCSTTGELSFKQKIDDVEIMIAGELHKIYNPDVTAGY